MCAGLACPLHRVSLCTVHERGILCQGRAGPPPQATEPRPILLIAGAGTRGGDQISAQAPQEVAPDPNHDQKESGEKAGNAPDARGCPRFHTGRLTVLHCPLRGHHCASCLGKAVRAEGWPHTPAWKELGTRLRVSASQGPLSLLQLEQRLGAGCGDEDRDSRASVCHRGCSQAGCWDTSQR